MEGHLPGTGHRRRHRLPCATGLFQKPAQIASCKCLIPRRRNRLVSPFQKQVLLEGLRLGRGRPPDCEGRRWQLHGVRESAYHPASRCHTSRGNVQHPETELLERPMGTQVGHGWDSWWRHAVLLRVEGQLVRPVAEVRRHHTHRPRCGWAHRAESEEQPRPQPTVSAVSVAAGCTRTGSRCRYKSRSVQDCDSPSQWGTVGASACRDGCCTGRHAPRRSRLVAGRLLCIGFGVGTACRAIQSQATNM